MHEPSKLLFRRFSSIIIEAVNYVQHNYSHSRVSPNFIMFIKYVSVHVAPGAGEGTSSGGDPTHPPRKKRARVDPTVESVSFMTLLCCFK